MDQHWYVAQLKPGGERLAVENLLRQGFGVFSPKMRRSVRRQGRFREEVCSLFPGYLFVGCAPDAASWRSIGGTLGVSRMVSFGGNGPSRVSPEIFDMLANHCGRRGADEGSPKRGDVVRVVSGPFVELIAHVETLPSQDRVFVLLDFMGEHRRVSLSSHQVVLETN